MTEALEKDFKELIAIGDYVEVSHCVRPAQYLAIFAYREKLWMFTRLNSTILWNGKGIDPRERKSTKTESKQPDTCQYCGK